MLNQIGICYFSPTHTTRKICQAIASGMGEKNPKILNITLPSVRKELISKPDSAMTGIKHLIVGAPVYEGKLPVQVIECLNALRGKDKKCTLVVVYGNRDYGIALRHMAEILTGKGFTITAAGAFIGQHSYSNVIPVAMGRPDEKDLELAAQFGTRAIGVSSYLTAEDMPIQIDMFSRSKGYHPLKPVFYPEKCSQCASCAEVCPIGIIDPETGGYIHRNATDDCIGCMACVFSCENEARMTKPGFAMKTRIKYVLRKAAVERLEPLTVFKEPQVQAT